jgi:hypothetical protein
LFEVTQETEREPPAICVPFAALYLQLANSREEKFSNTFGKTPVTLRVDGGYYKISSPGNRILKRHFGNIDTAVLDLRQDYEMADYLPNDVFSIDIFIEHAVTFKP